MLARDNSELSSEKAHGMTAALLLPHKQPLGQGCQLELKDGRSLFATTESSP